MKQFPVTAQMVVKNEGRFVWFAVQAVLPFVSKFLICDNDSSDNTWQILSSINSKKIILAQSKKTVVEIRKEQLKKTKTPWFLLVDGDEVWPQNQLIRLLQLTKELSGKKIAVINSTRNCAGDIWHYLPEEAGEYRLLGKKGHLNIRLMRNLAYKIVGQYPWEEYQVKGKSVSKDGERLAFSHTWYLHLSHLSRSGVVGKTPGRRKLIIERGIELRKEELPEVFFKARPKIVPDPLAKRSWLYNFQAELISPFKQLKRTIW